MSKLDELVAMYDPYLPSIQTGRTFYFDETNNIKKGIISFHGDNNKDLENLYFVLGGVALSQSLDFEELLKYVGARQSPIDT